MGPSAHAAAANRRRVVTFYMLLFKLESSVVLPQQNCKMEQNLLSSCALDENKIIALKACMLCLLGCNNCFGEVRAADLITYERSGS